MNHDHQIIDFLLDFRLMFILLFYRDTTIIL